MHANIEQKKKFKCDIISLGESMTEERVASKKQAKSINHMVKNDREKIENFVFHSQILFGKRITKLKGGWAIEAVAASNATSYTAVSCDMCEATFLSLHSAQKKNVMEY